MRTDNFEAFSPPVLSTEITRREDPAEKQTVPATERLSEEHIDLPQAIRLADQDLIATIKNVESVTAKLVSVPELSAAARIHWAETERELIENGAAMETVAADAHRDAVVIGGEHSTVDTEGASTLEALKEILAPDFKDFQEQWAALVKEPNVSGVQVQKAQEDFFGICNRKSVDFSKNLSLAESELLDRQQEAFTEYLSEQFANTIKDSNSELQETFIEGLIPHDMALGMIKRIELKPAAKKGLLLETARKQGSEQVKRNLNLYRDAGIGSKELADVYIEGGHRAAALELVTEMDNKSEQKQLAIDIIRVQPAFLDQLKKLSIDFSDEEKTSIIKDCVATHHPSYFAYLTRSFRLSETKIMALVNEFPPDKRPSLLGSLGVVGQGGERPFFGNTPETVPQDQDKLARFEQKKQNEKTEIERQVAETRDNSQALRLVIEAAWPWRMEREQSRAQTENELHGEIATVGELSGDSVNRPLYITLKDRAQPMPAVYKPRNRDMAGLRDGVPSDSYGMREWLAGQIDRALQIDVIPTTVVRDGPDGFGSVQDWKVGKMAVTVDWKKEGDLKGLRDTAFDDVVKGNTDRHDGNFLIGPDGQVHAIDHGLILDSSSDSQLRSYPLEVFSGQGVPDDVLKRIADFRAAPEVQDMLKKAFTVALGAEAGPAWQQFLNGVEQLSPPDNEKAGTFPYPAWH